MVATALEFYPLDDSQPDPRVRPGQRSGKRRQQAEMLALRRLDAFDTYLMQLYPGCEAMDISADTGIAQAGPGQFEINLMHQPDAVKAADDARLFKLRATGLARRFGFAASFMTKPYEAYSGNGLHFHFSVLDAAGHNVVDDGESRGSDILRHAIAGCLAALPGSMLILGAASHQLRSLRARHPRAHGHRLGLREPQRGNPGALGPRPRRSRRIEHRVAGSDINPCLLLAATLRAALDGIATGASPPEPITANGYRTDLPQILRTWEGAIAAFAGSPERAA